MKKRFNITGLCFKDIHYTMDASTKLEEVKSLIALGEYFTINRPRQYGKTTTLHFLQKEWEASAEYLVLSISLEGLEQSVYQSEEAFAERIVNLLLKELNIHNIRTSSLDLNNLIAQKTNFENLSSAISDAVNKLGKKIVLLIDEVDQGANYDVFLNFLGMLRKKYLSRFRPQNKTFHSVVLAGVHDIKTLKYRIKTTENSQYNSPWNIATDFEVQMSFNPSEITPMLEQYSKGEGVKMNTSIVAERLYYYTSGYPFLVSKLCKIIAEKIIPKRENNTWSLEDVETALRLILKENNTNFDSLIKNLENNQALYDLVYRVLINGDLIPFNQHNPTIHQGIQYGLFKENGQVKIHNRIYEQLVYNYMISKTLTNIQSNYLYGGHFLLKNNALDIESVLLKFQQFMKEQYSDKNKEFIEHHGRIIFLAFLAPILNGQGYSFKEVQTSLEKRLDVIITFFQHRYIIELKRWYGQKAHEEGLDQLADYLDIHGVDKGFLIIYDDRKNKPWHSELIQHQKKDIFAVWV